MNTERPPYEMYNGPIDSPVRLVDFYVYQGRQTGKTHKMIESLPNEPIYLVCHTRNWGEEIKRTIRQMRPDYDVKNITIIPYQKDTSEMWKTTRGMRPQPVYIDNAVLDMVQIEYAKTLNRMFGDDHWSL